jgi:hypothetical protein
MLRQLTLEDMDSAAVIHRKSFDQALPTLAGLHTPDEDRWFFKEQVFTACQTWGYFEETVLVGLIAFRVGWIDPAVCVAVLARPRHRRCSFANCPKPIGLPQRLDVPTQQERPTVL